MTIYLHNGVLAVSREVPDCVLHSAIPGSAAPLPGPSRKSLVLQTDRLLFAAQPCLLVGSTPLQGRAMMKWKVPSTEDGSSVLLENSALVSSAVIGRLTAASCAVTGLSEHSCFFLYSGSGGLWGHGIKEEEKRTQERNSSQVWRVNSP